MIVHRNVHLGMVIFHIFQDAPKVIRIWLQRTYKILSLYKKDKIIKGVVHLVCPVGIPWVQTAPSFWLLLNKVSFAVQKVIKVHLSLATMTFLKYDLQITSNDL